MKFFCSFCGENYTSFSMLNKGELYSYTQIVEHAIALFSEVDAMNFDDLETDVQVSLHHLQLRLDELNSIIGEKIKT